MDGRLDAFLFLLLPLLLHHFLCFFAASGFLTADVSTRRLRTFTIIFTLAGDEERPSSGFISTNVVTALNYGQIYGFGKGSVSSTRVRIFARLY